MMDMSKMDFSMFQDPSKDKDLLDKYGRIINVEVKAGKTDPVIGRDAEVRRLIEILSRKTKNNPVLIGEAGVGKTAIVESLVQRIVRSDVANNLLNTKIYELDLSSVIAGAMVQGEFEKRLKAIIEKISNDPNMILFIDELHLLVGAGKTQGAMDAGNILKPMLARGELHCIGATTLNEYRTYLEKDSALERRFQKIYVSEPTENQAITILRGLKNNYEGFHGVKIQDSAIIKAVRLSKRYITERFLPDKAIDLVDEACAKIKTEINSVPAVLDVVNRKVANFEMEKAVLTSEKTDENKRKLFQLEQDLKTTKQQQFELNEQWEEERKSVEKIKILKQLIQKKEHEIDIDRSQGNYAKAGEIQYGELPKLKEELKSLESKPHEKEFLVREEVTDSDIANVVGQWTGIPVNKLLESEKNIVQHLFNSMQKRVKGQDQALRVVTDAITRSRAGIKDPNQPIGSFLFLGPTGVGKTEVARTLAEILFDDSKNMVRLDMSEYMEKHSVSRLIGSPPGYVGFDEGGQLTEKIRRRPYSIVLFDEIEKAHQDVVNVLLQILEDGIITDGHGRTVDFKNTIVVMTSNLASQITVKTSTTEDEILSQLKGFFKPEFINRIGDTILFNKLKKPIVKQIIQRLLNDLKIRLEKEGYYISFGDKTVVSILEKSFNDEFGARPVKRFIQKEIETTIANKIIDGDIVKGKHYIGEYNKLQTFIAERRLN